MFSSFQLEFEDFAVEISQDCIYDAVVVYGDTEEEHQLGNNCLTVDCLIVDCNGSLKQKIERVCRVSQ